MIRNFFQILLTASFLSGCTTPPTEPLELGPEPTTADGLHAVQDTKDFTLYVSPYFAERARTGIYREKGQGLFIRSCNVTFADSDQEALFSGLRDRMQAHLCMTVKRELDKRGVSRIEADALNPETRVVDVWLLHVSLELPDVSGTSATTFVFSGASEEMTFGWVSVEAGSGLPVLRYYQRGRFTHRGQYLGSGDSPKWGDVSQGIDELADRALDTLLPAVFSVTRQPPIEPKPE